MKLEQLLNKIQPVQVIGNKNIEITGVNIDSRLIEPRYLFIAVKGTQTDGHTYISAAIEKGAIAIVGEELPTNLVEGITYIRVNDSENTVGKIATAFYGDPTSKLKLVGVTGTNGKTTIATLLYH
ncbi:UDP-N-acetylmuramoyl-L-alanyl-D-glutamate--2 6-diaminopimelate ligase, partial [termite gut metagenome]